MQHTETHRISKFKEIPIVCHTEKEQFLWQFLTDIYPKRKPVVMRGLDIGPCTQKWTAEYLAQVGGEREVKIHVSKTPQMNFINKNFMYKSLPFCELVRRASSEKQTQFFINETEKYYLRALGDDPRKDVADIRKQFPELAEDIHIPDFFPEEKFFSSVFRIASPGMQLWTHYDVMDNLLMQVKGRKRVVMFDPSSASYMYMNGDKSEVMEIDYPDMTKFPLFSQANRFEVILEPGDVLFIPALWFHNVISLDFGVAVNVFWKHLDDKMYARKDPYGNKDLCSAAKASNWIDKATKCLCKLPEEYRDFYARCLVAKIEQQCYTGNRSQASDSEEPITLSPDEEDALFPTTNLSPAPQNGLSQHSLPSQMDKNSAPARTPRSDAPDCPVHLPIPKIPFLEKQAGSRRVMEDENGMWRRSREPSPPPEQVLLTARALRVGSFRGVPLDPIIINKEGFSFCIKGMNGTYKFHIYPWEIEQCMVNFGKNPTLFFLTSNSCGTRTRKDLGIPTRKIPGPLPPEPYFDPVGMNMSHQFITVMMHEVEPETQQEFQKLMESFKSCSGKQDDEAFYMELSIDEANEILRQSCKPGFTAGIWHGYMGLPGMMVSVPGVAATNHQYVEPITLSSDEEEEAMGDVPTPATTPKAPLSQHLQTSQKSQSPTLTRLAAPDCPQATLIPNIPVIEKGAAPRRLMKDENGMWRRLRESSLSLEQVLLTAQVVGVGTFRGVPLKPIVINKEGFSFCIEGMNGTYKFHIYPWEIEQCMVNFDKNPTLFFLTSNSCGTRTRKDLGIPTHKNPGPLPPEPYFDPVGMNMPHLMIIVMLDEVEPETQQEFQKLMESFKSCSGKQDDKAFYMVLNTDEAYEILRQSCKQGFTAGIGHGNMGPPGMMVSVSDCEQAQKDCLSRSLPPTEAHPS